MGRHAVFVWTVFCGAQIIERHVSKRSGCGPRDPAAQKLPAHNPLFDIEQRAGDVSRGPRTVCPRRGNVESQFGQQVFGLLVAAESLELLEKSLEIARSHRRDECGRMSDKVRRIV